MVTMEQIQRGVSTYYEVEFCRKATGLGKFAAYFLLPSIQDTVAKYVASVKETPLMVGIVNDDGLFDIDIARVRALEAMKHCGSVELMGYRLDAGDIDKLYEAIRSA